MNAAMKSFCHAGGLALVLAMPPAGSWAGGQIDSSLEAFQAADFSSSPSQDITNPWWTQLEGSNFLYFADDGDECEWNLVEVTAITTDNFGGPYAGTAARVVLDREWSDEGCVYDSFADVAANLDPKEVTYDWYAQDGNQNIWYMGEHTINASGSSGGSFTAGCDGAEAGIVMLGNPDNGNFYQQEYYEGEAEDQGKVLTFAEFEDLICMKTKEWSPLSPGDIEHKFYCSDGEYGELTLIEELKGKTKIVELIATGIDAPPPPASPPNPIPADC
jgi:hypothetical protein